MSAQRAWLIDASIYIFRAWFSLPDRWQTKDGWPVHAVYGYSKFLLDFIDDGASAPYSCGIYKDKGLPVAFEFGVDSVPGGAGHVEKALARKQRMPELTDDQIPVVPASREREAYYHKD